MTATALTQITTVFVPVDDQDQAITSYRSSGSTSPTAPAAGSKWRRPDQRSRWPWSR